MKKKIFIVIVTIIVITTILKIAYFMIGNFFIERNDYKLKQNIQSISNTEITLNEIVPFEWDIVYTFSPYTPKAEIEKIIGFESNQIIETVSEGMVQLLFVKRDTVTASVCGYASEIGYDIYFNDKVEFKDNILFEVRRENGITLLDKK